MLLILVSLLAFLFGGCIADIYAKTEDAAAEKTDGTIAEVLDRWIKPIKTVASSKAADEPDDTAKETADTAKHYAENPEPSVPEEIIWHADLNHDGRKDTIKVEIINDGSTGDGAKLSVYTDAGVLIFADEADIPHVGWNGFYLYTDDTGEYLLNWLPTMYQGNCEFFYEIFSFDTQGEKIVYLTDSLEFDSFVVANEYKRLKEVVKFIQKVNSYLLDSPVLVDTDDMKLLYGTPENPEYNLYIPNWLFL